MGVYTSIYSGSEIDTRLGYVNQDIKSTASPTFVGAKLSGESTQKALFLDASGYIKSSATTLTELGYVSGVTSSIQTQLNGKAASSHVHGNITNLGKIGSTANLPLITTTDGVVTVGSFGNSANTFCQGNDSRLSDARTPTSHTHGNITNDGKIGTTADLPIFTTTDGVLTTKTASDARTALALGTNDSPTFAGCTFSGSITSTEPYFKNSAFNHGITMWDATDTYSRLICTGHGTQLRSYSDADASALTIFSILGTSNPTNAGVKITSVKKNGNDIQYLGINDRILSVGSPDTDSFYINGNGNSVFTSTGANNLGVTQVNATQVSDVPSSYICGSSTKAPNISGGAHVINMIGQDFSTGNAGYIGFSYTEADSASNYLSLGLFGYDDLFKLYKSGNISLNGSIYSKTPTGSENIFALDTTDTSGAGHNNYISGRNNNTQKWYVGYGNSDSNNLYLANTDATGNLQLLTNSTTRLTIDKDGNSTFDGQVEINSSLSNIYDGVLYIRNLYNNYDENPTVGYPVLLLSREGKSGTSWNSSASFGISRYENVSTDARTQLDINLGHGQSHTPDTTVMTLRSDGNTTFFGSITAPIFAITNSIALVRPSIISTHASGEPSLQFSSLNHNLYIGVYEPNSEAYIQSDENTPITFKISSNTALTISTDGYAAFASRFACNGETPQGKAAHIADANGTIEDITSKFNTLLAVVENYGLVAKS